MVTVVYWTWHFLNGGLIKTNVPLKQDIFRDLYITLLASQLTTKTGEEVNAKDVENTEIVFFY